MSRSSHTSFGEGESIWSMMPTLSQTYAAPRASAAARPSALQTLLLRVAAKLEERTYNPWFALQRSAVDKGNIHDVKALGRTLEQFHVLVSSDELELLFRSFATVSAVAGDRDPSSSSFTATGAATAGTIGTDIEAFDSRPTFDMKAFAATLFNRTQPTEQQQQPGAATQRGGGGGGRTQQGGGTVDILTVDGTQLSQQPLQQSQSSFAPSASASSFMPHSNVLGEERLHRATGGVRRVAPAGTGGGVGATNTSGIFAPGSTTTRPSALLRKAAASSLLSSPSNGSTSARGSSKPMVSARLSQQQASTRLHQPAGGGNGGAVTARTRPPPAAVPRFDFANINKLDPRYERPAVQPNTNRTYVHTAR